MSVWRLLRHGAMLCLAVATLSCRTSSPPPLDTCLGDGFGGADCSLREGSSLLAKCVSLANGGYYCPPSATKNMWMTTQEDMRNFAAFCYDVDQSVAASNMKAMRAEIRSKR